jgi:hypothetical protein
MLVAVADTEVLVVAQVVQAVVLQAAETLHQILVVAAVALAFSKAVAPVVQELLL